MTSRSVNLAFLYFMLITLFVNAVVQREVVAAQQLRVKQQLSVFAKPSLSSQIIGNLQSGDQVSVTEADDQGFRKIELFIKGKKTEGFVSERENSKFKVVDQEIMAEEIFGKTPHRRRSIGLSLIESYHRQGARQIRSADGQVNQIETLSGTNLDIGLLAVFPLNKSWVLRPGTAYRRFAVNGKGRQVLSSGVASELTEIFLDEEFFTFQTTIQYYRGAQNNLWVGLNAEIGKALNAKITYKSQSARDVRLSGQERPWFFWTHLAAGYDVEVTSRFFMTPELRVGFIANSSPLALNIALQLSLSRIF